MICAVPCRAVLRGAELRSTVWCRVVVCCFASLLCCAADFRDCGVDVICGIVF